MRKAEAIEWSVTKCGGRQRRVNKSRPQIAAARRRDSRSYLIGKSQDVEGNV